jgi:hypothetical protein
VTGKEATACSPWFPLAFYSLYGHLNELIDLFQMAKVACNFLSQSGMDADRDKDVLRHNMPQFQKTG